MLGASPSAQLSAAGAAARRRELGLPADRAACRAENRELVRRRGDQLLQRAAVAGSAVVALRSLPVPSPVDTTPAAPASSPQVITRAGSFGLVARRDAHQLTLLNTPITRPRTSASWVMIGW